MIRKIFSREIVSYLITGVLTTLVDYAVFALVNEALKASDARFGDPVLTATAVSWFAAVLFAYITNKLFVFRNHNFGFSHLIREGGAFFSARVLSGLITMALMWLMTGPLSWNEYLAKVLTSGFNVVFNYVASKIFIFKK